MNARIIKAEGRQGTKSFVQSQRRASILGIGFGGVVAATACRRQHKKGLQAAQHGLSPEEINGRVVRAVLRNLNSLRQAEIEAERSVLEGIAQHERRIGYIAW